jgi:hypothetical protein
MYCSDCGAEIEGDSKFCSSCGAALTSGPILCSDCGAELTEDAKFCVSCGSSVSTVGKSTDVTPIESKQLDVTNSHEAFIKKQQIILQKQANYIKSQTSAIEKKEPSQAALPPDLLVIGICSSCNDQIEFPLSLDGSTTECPSCGSETELHAPKDDEENERLHLWNPNVASSLSVFFTPIFGAYVHAKNWIELGDRDKAETNKKWVTVYTLYLVLSFIFILLKDLSTLNPNIPRASGSSVSLIVSVTGVLLLLGWYFTQGKPQADYIKENYFGEFDKKGWGIPISIAFGAFLFLMMVFGAIYYFFEQLKFYGISFF